MAFWSETSLEPKRQFKFRVSFRRPRQENSFLAQSADRPQFKISETATVDFLDKKFYFPGKVTWEPVKIKFVDGARGDANMSRDSYLYLGQAGWISPANFAPNGTGGTGNSYRTIGKAAANNSLLGDVSIYVLDSAGAAIDSWTLKNAFITSVVLNNLDYAAEAILTAEYTFRFDWAELGGVGR